MNTNQRYIIGLGASAGGLDAIQGFFEQVPIGLPCTFVVLQHQRGERGSLLTDLLRHRCSLPIQDASDGMQPDPGVVIVAPPGNDLTFDDDGTLRLQSAERQRGWYPIDRLFESLAQGFGEQALGIVLSGTGSDGTLGARALKERGGTVFVQDPDSAGFDGMPNATIAAGLADVVGRPRDLARQLSTLCLGGDQYHADIAVPIADHLRNQILSSLRGFSTTDFSFYKDGYIDQRINRRMRFKQVGSPEEYLRLVMQSSAEQARLGRDLLLRVSRMFPTDDTFQRLPEHLEQKLLAHPADVPFRVWIPGCNTGEEAVSIAIFLQEILATRASAVPLQIFASDVEEAALQTARKGLYPTSVSARIDEARLERFFDRTTDGWQVDRLVRHNIVYARHDISTDPPYTRLDFIACRNLLSRLQERVQRNIVERLLYALRPGGELLLGYNEDIDAEMLGYQPVIGLPGLLRKSDDSGRGHGGWMPLPLKNRPAARPRTPARPMSSSSDLLTEFLLEEVLTERDVAAFVVDRQAQVLAAHGLLDLYLRRLPDGETPLDDLVKPQLRPETVAALRDAGKSPAGTCYEDILLNDRDTRRSGKVSVRQIHQGGQLHELFTVVFACSPIVAPENDQASANVGELRILQSKTRFLEGELEDSLAARRTVEHELEGLREQLLTTRDELGATSEELLAVSSELDQQASRLRDVSLDYDNLLRETDTGILVLGGDLSLSRFTAPFDHLLNLSKDDLGRNLAELGKLSAPADLEAQVTFCLDTLRSSRLVMRSGEERYDVRISPYRKPNNAVDGILLRAHRMRQRGESEDTLSYLSTLVYAHEQLGACTTADDAIGHALDQVRRYPSISFVAWCDLRRSLVRPESVVISRQALQDLAGPTPEQVRFLTEQDVRVHVDGASARAALIMNPQLAQEGPYLLVGSTDPDVFCDGYVNRLMGLGQALSRRSHQ